MTRPKTTLDAVLRGTSDPNIRFEDLCALLKSLGFEMRIRGGHHLFHRDDVFELVNLQAKGSMAKAYQVKQVRGIILKYKLGKEKE